MKSVLIDISSEELEDEDVIITGEDQLDPELTARLHERVLQIKKEIHWSEDEQDDEDIPIDPLTSVLSPEYIDINSCSDTCDSDFEEEPPPTPPSPRFLGSNKLSHSVLIKSTPLLESNTNNGSSPSTSLIKCSRRFPVLEVKRTPVHKRRATEPYPSNSNNVTHLPHHYHPQRNDHPSSIDSYSCPHCCVLPVQVQYSCDCPSCRLQRSNICMCPSCMDSLPALSDHPFTFYSAPSPPCLCVTCSDQQSLLNSSAPLSQPFHCNRPASYSNAHGVDCCSCQEAGCDESSSLHLADLTRGKRQLEEDFNSPPVTKRPCT